MRPVGAEGRQQVSKLEDEIRERLVVAFRIGWAAAMGVRDAQGAGEAVVLAGESAEATSASRPGGGRPTRARVQRSEEPTVIHRAKVPGHADP